MEYGLPKTVEINGKDYEIRYDFRAILDIFSVMNDFELSNEERALAVLQIFYLDFNAIDDYQTAINKCLWFINGGRDNDDKTKQKKLVDWEQDYSYIVAPINRVLGMDVRGIPYDPKSNTGGLHWWTFLSGYLEIGDCLFAQIVRIRSLKASGKPLDKQDKEFYRKNRDIIDIKTHYTEAENDLVGAWMPKG